MGFCNFYLDKKCMLKHILFLVGFDRKYICKSISVHIGIVVSLQ